MSLIKRFVRLQKLYDIRWLCRLQTVKAVVNAYEALVTYFENKSNRDVAAEGLAKQLKSYRFALTKHVQCDILSTLCHPKKIFQKIRYHANLKVNKVVRALNGRYLQDDIKSGPHATQCIIKIEDGQLVVDTGHMTATEVAEIVKRDILSFVQGVI